jgi:hypothetical protein
MALNKVFPNHYEHRKHTTLRVRTNLANETLLVVHVENSKASEQARQYGDVSPFDWYVDLDLKSVAALHAILTNWLKKRDRRVGPKERRTLYPSSGRRVSVRYRDLPVSLERRGTQPGLVGRRSYMLGGDRRKSTAR